MHPSWLTVSNGRLLRQGSNATFLLLMIFPHLKSNGLTFTVTVQPQHKQILSPCLMLQVVGHVFVALNDDKLIFTGHGTSTGYDQLQW